MAQSVMVILEDDLDGGLADESVQFSLDGKQYEIDLNRANAKKLRETLHPVISSGQQEQVKQARAAGARTTAADNPEAAKIRAWAQENGRKVSDRGRIAQEIRQVNYAATS
ncbi:Lsr2 family protein [Kocuria sp. CPCC 205292]|uniref:histone-like nucleoid-structuring protein Lsr2 n=1 Tax=Kocuria cellulosilytica TaxID=3071451 RepID=UPI0034D61BE8